SACRSICLAGVLPCSAAATFPLQQHRELYQISPALKPAAPEEGRTPINRYPADQPWRPFPAPLSLEPVAKVGFVQDRGCVHPRIVRKNPATFARMWAS